MIKRKIGATLLAVTMAASLFAGCSSSTDSSSADSSSAETSTSASTSESEDSTSDATVEKTVVSLYATGSDNVREVYEALIEDFNNNSEYSDLYEVELTFMLSGTGTQTLVDLVAATYEAGQEDTDFDIVDFGGDDLSNIISQIGEEAFVKLDYDKIPNAEGIDAQSSVATEYAQPYRGTTVVLAYDSDVVTDPPTTWDELVEWMEANPGRFAYNTPGTGGAGDSFARTAVYNFIDEEALTSDDPAWEEYWDEGFEFLAEIHQYMYSSGGSIVYPNKNQGTLDLLNQGEIDMCANWADMVLSQRAEGSLKDSIMITQLDPALTGSFQCLTIPTFGSNEDGAYAFIDYMLSATAQEIMVQQMAAIPLIDASEIDMTGFEDVQNIDVSEFRFMSIGDLSTDFNERWDNEIGSLG